VNNPNLNTQNAILIIERLKDLTEIKKDLHLAKLLGIAATTLSNWKSRNSIDYKLVITFCIKRKFDLGFVLAGINPQIKNSQIENLATDLIVRIRKEIQSDIQQITNFKEYLAENFDKIKAKEEIELAKEKISKVGNRNLNQPLD